MWQNNETPVICTRDIDDLIFESTEIRVSDR